MFKEDMTPTADSIEVSMPVGLYTSCEVTRPAAYARPRASSACSMCPTRSSIPAG